MKEKKWNPVNLWVAVPVIMQAAIAAMMLWGFLWYAWQWSWLWPYIGVILCLELYFYNAALKKGEHPIKALYPILIMLGCAFLFTGIFAFHSFKIGLGGLALAAVGFVAVLLIDRKKNKKA